MSFIMQTRVALSFPTPIPILFSCFSTHSVTCRCRKTKTQQTSFKLTIFHLKITRREKKSEWTELFSRHSNQRTMDSSSTSSSLLSAPYLQCQTPHSINKIFDLGFSPQSSHLHIHLNINYSSFWDLDCFYECFGCCASTNVFKTHNVMRIIKSKNTI